MSIQEVGIGVGLGVVSIWLEAGIGVLYKLRAEQAAKKEKLAHKKSRAHIA